MKENDFILLVLSWNVVSGIPDGKPWDMSLSQNRFTMLTHIPFLAVQLSINIPVMPLTSWLLTLYAKSMLYMANGTCIALQHSSARPSWSIV